MNRLFQFLYRYRAFLFFLLIQSVCAWLIVNNNAYQSASFFNSSNRLVGNFYASTNALKEYLNLREVNESLVEENANLRSRGGQVIYNTAYLTESSLRFVEDSLQPFEFIPAKVVNNSTRRFTNFITINKGRKDGIEEDMAVLSSQGVVGKVKSVSQHFATVISLLHTEMMVSSSIKRNQVVGTSQWDGTDPLYVDLKYIPRHVQIQVGDTVVTSGFNSIFPPDIMIGLVENVNLSDNASFYDIDTKLIEDFHRLSYVYVVKNKLRQEKDSLEIQTQIIEP